MEAATDSPLLANSTSPSTLRSISRPVGKRNLSPHRSTNGDTSTLSLCGVGDIANVDAIQVVSEIHFQKSGTGRFARRVSGISPPRSMVDIGRPPTPLFSLRSGASFLKNLRKSEHSAIGEPRRRIQKAKRAELFRVPPTFLRRTRYGAEPKTFISDVVAAGVD